MSEPGSSPGPTLISRALRSSRSISGSAASPTATVTAIAMQRWPAEPKPAAVRWLAAKSRSASGITTAWFFAPPSACTRLPFAVPRLVDVPGDRRRADERHGRDVRMLEQRVDRDLVAVHDVEHSVGKPRLGVQLGDEVRGRGVALGRLEHERVAARDRHRVHPHRDHGREVERGDARAHAERLAERVGVDVGRHLVGVLALEQLRQAARVLDDLEPADHLALGVLDHLAVLGGDDPRQVVDVPLDQVAEREHHARAARERDVAPGLERGRGRLHGAVDVLALGEHHLRLDLAGRGVVDGRRTGRAAGRLGSPDAVLDRPRRRRAHGISTLSRVLRWLRLELRDLGHLHIPPGP